MTEELDIDDMLSTICANGTSTNKLYRKDVVHMIKELWEERLSPHRPETNSLITEGQAGDGHSARRTSIPSTGELGRPGTSFKRTLSSRSPISTEQKKAKVSKT